MMKDGVRRQSFGFGVCVGVVCESRAELVCRTKATWHLRSFWLLHTACISTITTKLGRFAYYLYYFAYYSSNTVLRVDGAFLVEYMC